eukprot:3960755-Prymnesium_polylepis.1
MRLIVRRVRHAGMRAPPTLPHPLPPVRLAMARCRACTAHRASHSPACPPRTHRSRAASRR